MTTELTIREAFDLQLTEVSGICERTAGGGRPRQLLAVGDDSHELLVGDLTPAVPGGFARHDLAPLLTAAGVEIGRSSQWEGVDSDETGRVFVLREVPGTVFVFDAALERLLHVLHLTVEDDPGEERAWAADENALGEGLLLLRNGHLFVVKEEKPRQLLEFGLPGERPQGLHGDLLVADTGRFPPRRRRRPPSTCCRPGTWAGRRWSGWATSATSPSAPTAACTCSATSRAASPGSRPRSRPRAGRSPWTASGACPTGSTSPRDW